MNIKEITARAKAAARLTRNLSIETRNGVLMQFAYNLRSAEQKIIAANQHDELPRMNSGQPFIKHDLGVVVDGASSILPFAFVDAAGRFNLDDFL